ncbi:hypothetical protein [Jiella mangrovi]|uniref:Secreted protein n=1 Tax=Jiella mangrovi TaxID=2821407 RepID=A0ABS4BDD7_9HYPH|nr:hypothetical protein [Jiella mangrovi]MBP0614759.1 hypothetical protein [Jiella mangrovi]
MAILRTILAFAVSTGLSAGPAFAYQGGGGDWSMSPSAPPAASAPQDVLTDEAPELLFAASDCSGAASRAARQTGGQVLSVSTQNQGGKTVCVVTVLVPGKGDQRPRKQTITIRP